jgi:Putative peptidoglycan binding domain
MLQVEVDPPSSPAPGTGEGEGDEDWLADVGDVDWDDANAPTGERPAQRASRWSTAGFGAISSPGGHPPAESDIQRRRAIAAIVAIVVVGLAIAIPVIVFGGGGGSSTDNPNETPPVTTTPPATTTPTTPKTTTTQTTTTPSTAQKLDLPAGTTLKVGSSGAQVTQLQNALKTLGYDPGKADGAYGPQTKAAVEKFQTAKGLSADGVVGAETAKAINDALAAKSSAG